MAFYNPTLLTAGGNKLSYDTKESIVNSVTRERVYNYWRERIVNIGLSRFRWLNLPGEIDERFLELALMESGEVCFFRDKYIGYATLPLTSNTTYDIYGNPEHVQCEACNSYISPVLNKGEFVIIYNNKTRTGEWENIKLFADILTENTIAVIVNLKQQKTTKIIKCDESERLTYNNILKKQDNGQPYILGVKNLGIDGALDVLDLSSPFIADKLEELQNNLFNDVMTYFGVANADQKRERVISSEISSQLGDVSISREVGLSARKQACSNINRLWGLNIDVIFNENNIIGGDESEPLHDTDSVYM